MTSTVRFLPQGLIDMIGAGPIFYVGQAIRDRAAEGNLGDADREGLEPWVSYVMQTSGSTGRPQAVCGTWQGETLILAHELNHNQMNGF